ncbi:MAG: hypothetical protein H6811_01425 [Phycisphaeraceae bacterium]|nr:hypothetical protein [Phycisphaeraceae bacterium]
MIPPGWQVPAFEHGDLKERGSRAREFARRMAVCFTIIGLFSEASDAIAAVDDLEFKGVPLDDISVLAAEETWRTSRAFDLQLLLSQHRSPHEEGRGTLGGRGLMIACPIHPDGATVLGAGPMADSIHGSGATHAWILGVLMPEHESGALDEVMRRGAVLVGVECRDETRRTQIERVFEAHQAVRVSQPV